MVMKKILLLIGAFAQAKIGVNVSVLGGGAFAAGSAKGLSMYLFLEEMFRGPLYKEHIKATGKTFTSKEAEKKYYEEEYMKAVDCAALAFAFDQDKKGTNPLFLDPTKKFGLKYEESKTSGGRFTTSASGTLDLYHVPVSAHDNIAFGTFFGLGMAIGSVEESTQYSILRRSINSPMLYFGPNIAYQQGQKLVIEGGLYGVMYSEKISVAAKFGNLDIEGGKKSRVDVNEFTKKTEGARKNLNLNSASAVESSSPSSSPSSEAKGNNTISQKEIYEGMKKSIDFLPESKMEENSFSTKFDISLGFRLSAKYFVLKDLAIAAQFDYIMSRKVSAAVDGKAPLTPALAMANAHRTVESATDYELEANRAVRRNGLVMISLGLTYRII